MQLKMIKNSTQLTITTLITSTAVLFTQSILTTHLTKHQYGQFQLILSWIALLGFFSLNSFNTTVIRALAQKYKVFFKSASKLCFITSILGSVSLMVFGKIFESELFNLFIISAFFFPLYSGLNLASSFYLGSSKLKKYSLLAISTQSIVSGMQILAVLLFKELYWLLFFTLFTASLINLGITLQISSKIHQKKKENLNQIFIKYGFFLFGMNIFSSISSKLQYIILATLTGPSILAEYFIAQMMIDKLTGLIKSSLNPITLYLAKQKKEQNLYFFKNGFLLFIIYGMIIGIVTIITIPAVIKVFFPNYMISTRYALALLPLLVLTPLNSIAQAIIVYQGYKRINTTINLSFNTIKIFLFLFTIPFWGVEGVIFSIVISTVIVAFFNLFFLSRELKKLMCNKKSKSVKRKESTLYTSTVNGQDIINAINSKYLSIKGDHSFLIKFVAKLSKTKFI